MASYFIRQVNEKAWHGPFGPLRDLTAAAMLFARVNKIKPGHSMELQISPDGSSSFHEVLVTRDEDGVGYKIDLQVEEEPADSNDPGENGII